MIKHTVAFRLHHAAGSEDERHFLRAAQRLAGIPGVEKFETFHQISTKNPYHFGLSMEFASPDAYAAYNQHPEHIRFVQERWVTGVAEFMELDYEPTDF